MKKKQKTDLRLQVVRPKRGVDWTGMIGYSADAKSPTSPKGLGFEVVWEASNRVLRVYTSRKYRYLNAQEATELLGLLVRAMQKTLTGKKAN